MKRTALKRTGFKKGPKEKKCRCGNIYVQFNSLTKCVECQVQIALASVTPGTPQYKKKVSQAKRDFKAKYDISWWKKTAQDACNGYIRHRDANKNCVTCGEPNMPSQQWDAGHMRSVGAHSMLRYCEQNINGQHNQCNTKNNDISSYKSELQKRYGAAIVEWLSVDYPVYKWRIEDLMAITLYYRNMLRILQGKAIAYKLRGYPRITTEVEHWIPNS